jgi:DNA topoisomerase-1
LKLLLIESAGKIKKLKSILGSEWNIKATMGHVVELANDGEDSLGFTLDTERNRIDCRYVPRGTRGNQVLKELRQAVKQASEVLIATDADREGETIGWHLGQQLHLKNPRRVVYTEITEKAVRQAIAHARSLDLNLIAAGRCRDTLDKLVGYKGSPLLWKLGNGARSMGRVQSAALHILCQREREIEAFVPQDYWSVYVDYVEEFRAYYAGTTLSPEAEADSDSSDDAADTKDKIVESVRVLSQEQAENLVAQARSHAHHVVRVDAKTTSRKPPAPFTTSSLQQAAGSRLKYGAEKTMKLAQTLYEQGYITYMRTDSVALSDEYCKQARLWLQQHDPQNVPQRVAVQKSKAGAQEAHEAIRPTHVENTPDSLSAKLSQEEAKLYCLIWGRALASQCKPAQLQKTRIVTQSGTVFWQAKGQVVTFRGYTTYWNDISNDSQLPVVQQRQTLTLKQAGSQKKQTQPPPRYSEPKLVQTMEKRGIGRPSTYAPTVKVLRDRNYACLVKGHLQPTQLGMEVDEFLERVLPDLIKSDFTAAMERALDDVAAGKQQWESYLINWNETYFAPALEAAYRSLGKDKKDPLSEKKSRRRSSQAELTETRSNRKSRRGSNQALTEIHCPKCEWLMQKILSRSEKLKADHFLKCSNKACGAAMFWSDKQQKYELSYSEHQESAPLTKNATPKAAITEFTCPVCAKPLELYEYTKGNEHKQMLRCSDSLKRRQDDHKDVAYFASKGVFWSPKYGEIKKIGNSSKSTSTKHPCPVCSEPLELYEYTKGNEKKQMLRCSDAQARRRDDHKDVAYFASRGVFWSPKYGEIKPNKSLKSKS